MKIRRIRHLREMTCASTAALIKAVSQKDTSLTGIVNVVSAAYALDKGVVERIDMGDLVGLYRSVMRLLEDETLTNHPADVITLQGVEYELTDFAKLPGGWYILADKLSPQFEASPELLPALRYVEKGMRFNEVDKHGNVKNPLNERAKIFAEHYPGDEFVRLHAFFLKEYEMLQIASLRLQATRMKIATRNLKKIKPKRKQTGRGLFTR